MDRRKFLIISALTPLAGIVANHDVAFGAAHSFGFATDGSKFLLDGQPFQIRSGEMHPARIPVEYWRHRIQMAKAMGMNTISLYIMWNYHEELQGTFDFHTDRRDIAAFIRLCQAEGMWVLLRPGPYVCGEWDLGGLPAYLLANDPISLRVRTSADAHYMAAVQRYVEAVAAVISPLLIGNGGPILMVQVENEYGSYGSDATYLAEIRQLWINAGITGPFYTEDGLDQVKASHTNVAGGAIALSGGDASQVATCRSSFPLVPAMVGELYPGWLTHWGDRTFAGQDSDISATLNGLMSGSVSFNIYVIHGGTSFGYWAGANADDASGNYQPDITSYDYSAPVSEQGVATAKYTQYRNLIASYLTTPLPAVPAPIPTITLSGSQALLPTAYASLWDNLPAPLPASRTVNPAPMETYGQNSGFMLYRKPLSGYSGGTLGIQWVHDYATVFLNGSYQGGFSRPTVPASYATPLNVTIDNNPLTLAASGTNTTLDILVEGMGRTNFGQALVDRKGILESVSLTNAGTLTGTLTGWQTYPLPVDEAYIAGLSPKVSDPSRPGIFFRTTFTLTTTGDTYVDTSGWTKGLVWVNGHNLGRYWQIGPQQRLYCPASWLVTGQNELIVLDLHQTVPQEITFQATLNGPGPGAPTTYTVTNRRSGKALDVPGFSKTAGVQLIQWTPNGGTNQQWRRTSVGAGTYTLTNISSGQLADVNGSATADGTPIIQWPSTGGANQQWRVLTVDSTHVKLVNAATGKLLGVNGSAMTDGATITEQTDTGDIGQQWVLTAV